MTSGPRKSEQLTSFAIEQVDDCEGCMGESRCIVKGANSSEDDSARLSGYLEYSSIDLW